VRPKNKAYVGSRAAARGAALQQEKVARLPSPEVYPAIGGFSTIESADGRVLRLSPAEGRPRASARADPTGRER